MDENNSTDENKKVNSDGLGQGGYDPLKKVEDRLYRPGQKSAIGRRSGFSGRAVGDSKQTWSKDEVNQKSEVVKKDKPIIPFYMWWLVAIVVIGFIITTVVAGWVFFSGGNIISGREVQLNFSIPSTIKSGSLTPIRLTVSNFNQVPLSDVKLLVKYPEGTLTENGDVLDRQEIDLDGIKADELFNLNLEPVLFGEPGTVQTLEVEMFYRLPDSSANYRTENEVELNIDSASVQLDMDIEGDVVSGQEAAIKINIVSDARIVLPDVVLNINYPNGFEMLTATPEPTAEDNFWRLGDLEPGSEKEILIYGRFTGQDGEIKSFTLVTGSQSSDQSEISPVLAQDYITTEIERPLLGANLSIDGRSTPVVNIDADSNIRTQVQLVNNYAFDIEEVELDVRLPEEFIDLGSLSVTKGSYVPTRNVVIWRQSSLSDLKSIAPGQKVDALFSFKVYSLTSSKMAEVRNVEFPIELEAQAVRIGEEGARETISTNLSRQVRVNSTVQLLSQIYYSLGPFENEGPLPPEVGETTTYTVSLSLLNAGNDLINGQAKIKLPLIVEWLNVHESSVGDLEYDKADHTVIWNLPKVTAGAGVERQMEEAHFQIGLTPGSDLAGSRFVSLVKRINFTAMDEFTGESRSVSLEGLDNQLRNDPVYQLNIGNILP
ncbi:MAG: hypothetical protein ACOCU8_03585 [Patescibacteria group bacterium]